MSSWVLLRGLSRERRHWGAFPELLRAADGNPVVALDLPGNGRRHRLRSPASVGELAADCRRQLQAQGLVPPYRLLALSLGAMVAVAWAGRHPDEVAGGVLINTSLRPFSSFFHRLRPAHYPALLGLLLEPDAGRRERRILELTSNRPPEPQLLAEWTAWAGQNPVAPANALRQLLAAARFVAPPVPPAVPLLVLGSAGDRLVDVRCSRQLARCWQVAYAEHPSAGHDLPLDDAAWVVGQVGRWWQEQPLR
ncbi:MAG TPA: alpha/beta hydrolase [Azonexus sp.]